MIVNGMTQTNEYRAGYWKNGPLAYQPNAFTTWRDSQGKIVEGIQEEMGNVRIDNSRTFRTEAEAIEASKLMLQ